MYDYRQNRQGYTEEFEVYARKIGLPRGSKIEWEKLPACRFSGTIYSNQTSSASDIDGVFMNDDVTLVIKTGDRVSVNALDRVVRLETGKSYVVSNISIDTRKKRFKARYDRFAPVDTYLTVKGA